MPQNLGIKPGSYRLGKEFPKAAGAAPVETVTETWQVIADNLNQTAADILNTPGLPSQGDTRGNMGAKSVTAREANPHALQWEVDVEWDSRVDGQNEGEDPTLWLPDVKWSSETIEIAIATDQVTGKPIVNSVDEPFFITGPVTVSVRTLSRLEPYSVLDQMDVLQQQYANHLNSVAFRGWEPYTVLLASIDGQRETVARQLYCRATYVTKYLRLKSTATYQPIRSFDPDGTAPVSSLTIVGWRASILNQGTKYLETAGDSIHEAKEAIDGEGNPTTVNLKADGTKLPNGTPGVYLRWFRNPITDLGPLNI